MDLKELSRQDPLKRIAEKHDDEGGTSPMEPPEAYDPPSRVAVPHAELHPFLRELVDEHAQLTSRLRELENMLQEIEAEGLRPEHGPGLRDFFAFFDAHFVPHHRKEERRLFPLLRERLLAHGEHSPSSVPITGVDVLEDDHARAMKQAAAACTCMGLATRLPDPESGMVALATGIKQASELIEHVRLHMFREENIIFGQAQLHLSQEELDHL